MALLDRVEQVSGNNSIEKTKTIDRNKSIEFVRDLLFEMISSSRIAQMFLDDPNRAKREVAGALESIINSGAIDFLGEYKDGVVKEVFELVVGLGPIQNLLDDPDVTEIMANGPTHLFFEKDGVLHKSDATFSNAEQMRLIIDRILGPVGRRVDEQSPMVSARLEGGYRVNVVIKPLALDGPYLTIRKFRKVMYTLDEMVQLKTIDSNIRQFLSWAIKARLNIAVSGGTGSGKTTFLNALSRDLPHKERIVTIEDAAELRFEWHPHVVRLEARPANTEGVGEVTIRDLVINALRMRPDRIVVGECRGAEALDMLQAMNTGHNGSLTTLHANSTLEVVGRLITMVKYGSDLPTDVIKGQIASALNLIVHVERQSDGSRRVVEISQCRSAGDDVEVLPLVKLDFSSNNYIWSHIPRWVTDPTNSDFATNSEVQRWCSQLSLQY